MNIKRILAGLIIVGLIALGVMGAEKYIIGAQSGQDDSISALSDNNNDKPNTEEEKSDIENRFEGLTLKNDDSGVPVLCYHSITDDESSNGPIAMSKKKFKEQLQSIKDLAYTTLTLNELGDYLFNNKPVPEKSVVLTFDDGYKDNYTNAYPILKDFGMKATFFVIADYSFGENAEHSRFLTPDEMMEMQKYGIEIQSHTVSHRELGTLSYEEQLAELKNSKKILEEKLGNKVESIAYPIGSFNEDTKKAVNDADYKMAFTIDRGYADRNDNNAQLNRICIDYTYGAKDIKKVLTKLKK